MLFPAMTQVLEPSRRVAEDTTFSEYESPEVDVKDHTLLDVMNHPLSPVISIGDNSTAKLRARREHCLESNRPQSAPSSSVPTSQAAPPFLLLLQAPQTTRGRRHRVL